jgi:hypothetical protein
VVKYSWSAQSHIPLAIQTVQGSKFSTSIGPRGQYGDHVNAFVFLNFYVGADRTIIEEMWEITGVSQTRVLQNF